MDPLPVRPRGLYVNWILDGQPRRCKLLVGVARLLANFARQPRVCPPPRPQSWKDSDTTWPPCNFRFSLSHELSRASSRGMITARWASQVAFDPTPPAGYIITIVNQVRHLGAAHRRTQRKLRTARLRSIQDPSRPYGPHLARNNRQAFFPRSSLKPHACTGVFIHVVGGLSDEFRQAGPRPTFHTP